MEDLRKELEALFHRLTEILVALSHTRPDPVTLYTPLGAGRATVASCTDDLVCDSVLNMHLVAQDGEVLPFQLYLTLAFRSDGTLAEADALACAFVCESDSGVCSCS